MRVDLDLAQYYERVWAGDSRDQTAEGEIHKVVVVPRPAVAAVQVQLALEHVLGGLLRLLKRWKGADWSHLDLALTAVLVQ